MVERSVNTLIRYRFKESPELWMVERRPTGLPLHDQVQRRRYKNLKNINKK
jgi:hypothetical protein